MKFVSLIQCLFASRWGSRKLADLSSDDALQEALMAYAKLSATVRTAVVCLLPLVSACVLVLSGSWWIWWLPVVFLVNLSWCRLVGCRPLAKAGQERLTELLKEARKDGLLLSVEPLEKSSFVREGHEDLLLLCSLVLSPSGRSQVQARLLGEQMPQASPSSQEASVRRL